MDRFCQVLGPRSFSSWIFCCPSTICWENCFFSPLSNSLGILVKIQMTVNVSLFLDSQFCIDLCLSLYQHHTALITDYCSFVESFEVRKCEHSLFLLFKIVLTLLAPLNFYMNFMTSLSISAKKPAGVLALNLYINLGSIVTLTEFNLLIH